MAIFSLKKKAGQGDKKATKPAKQEEVKKEASIKSAVLPAEIIIKPLITEKAHFLSAGNVYTFAVAKEAGKKEVASAVKKIYGVSPKSVAIVRIKGKRVYVRGREGRTNDKTKAYVSLKEGDKINLS